MKTEITNFNRTLHLCSIDHDEVCFSGDTCPVCVERRMRKDLELAVVSRLDILESAFLENGKMRKEWMKLADNFREQEATIRNVKRRQVR